MTKWMFGVMCSHFTELLALSALRYIMRQFLCW